MGKGNKDVKKQEQAMQSHIEEMENLINSFQEEYDKKKGLLQEAQDELNKLTAEADSIKKEFRSDIRAEIEGEYSSKMAEVANLKKEVQSEKEEVELLKLEAAEIKDEANQFDTETRKKANEYLSEKTKEADVYFSTKKSEIEKIYQDKQTEIKNLSDELSAKKTQFDKEEKLQIEKGNKLAEKEIELSRKEEDAKFGFKTVLAEERKKFDDQISVLKDEIANLEKKKIEGKAKIDDELSNYKKDGIKNIDAQLEDQRKELKKEQEKLNAEKSKLDAREREIQVKEAAIKIQGEAYKTKFSEIDALAKEKMEEFYAEAINDRDMFKKRCNELSDSLDEAKKKNIALIAKLKDGNGVELDSLRNENTNLKKELETIRDSESSILKKLKEYNVDSAGLVSSLYKIDEYDSLLAKYEQLNGEYETQRVKNAEAINNEQALSLETRRANQYQQNYEAAIAELDRMKSPSRKDRLSSFTSFDSFDNITNLPIVSKNSSELNWLKNISQKMKESGIIITDKLLYAFHTSVKIHEWSPIVVLAGVSGTGKSELPKQYAHHGGMNFISVPVKPDWDSMQSLFGYYNSIENKFEPTELSRAIYYMQNDNMKDTMLLVLLDEMNLAHVELYFSDLLSKFETNRGTDDKIMYEISLGANEAPAEMEIGDNILWVGTMNEDETTKALSDKVIDRSTLLTFPRPKNLFSRKSDSKIAPAEKRMTFDLWQKWCNVILSEDEVKAKIDIDKYRRIVEDINEQMSKVNRNLGHRVWQSIERYAFSHPLVIENFNNGVEFKKQFESAFAEAVAFKVMPKLRGIEVSGESKKVLDSISSIISQEIPVLEEDYKHAMGLSSRIFQWCSAKFMDADITKGDKQ